MGLLRYLEIKEKQQALNTELQLIEKDNAILKESLAQHRDDSFFLEKHARENFGLVGEDETIYIYKD